MTAPSLQRQLPALVLGLAAAVWLGTAVLTWFDARHELDELLDGRLPQAAALLVLQQVGDMGDDQHAVDAPSLHRHAPKIAFQVFHEGRLVLRSANAPTVPMLPPSDGFRSVVRSVRIGSTDWRVFAAYGAERDVQVYNGEQLRSRASILWALLRATLQPLALAEADDALRRHALQATLQGGHRATGLVEQLLTLSRLESAEAPALDVLDLSELVRGAVGELAPKALSKQQHIELEAAPACRVRGQATLIAVRVRNLVDNAIRYIPPGTRARMAVAA